MPFSFDCETCQKSFTVSRKLIGKKIRCKACSAIMRVPDPVVAANSPSKTQTQSPPLAPAPSSEPVVAPTSPAPVDSVPTFVLVECDDCRRKHKPNRKLMGKKIRCSCGTTLLVTDDPEAAQMKVAPAEPELVDPYVPAPLPTPDNPASSQLPAWQAPPPSFQSKPKTIRDQRREEAEARVNRVEEKEDWRRTPNKGGGNDSDSMLNAGIVGGILMILGGAGLLIGGLMFDRIFYFAPIIVICGIISLVRGLV